MNTGKVVWALVAALVFSITPALQAETLDRVMTMSPPRPIADFELTDQKGARKRLSSLSGQPALVFFGFTNCPEICPTTMQKLAQLKSSQSSELEKLQVVLISVDGERDTPEAMAEFLKQFPKDFIGLTGPSAQVRDIALRFSAPFFKNPPKDGTYLVEHSSRVYALDKQGHLRAELFDAPNDSMLTLARALLKE
jgi:protein SCO1